MCKRERELLISSIDPIFHGYRNDGNNEPRHEISNKVDCVTSKGSDQPAHTGSLIRAFASSLTILRQLKLDSDLEKVEAFFFANITILFLLLLFRPYKHVSEYI